MTGSLTLRVYVYVPTAPSGPQVIPKKRSDFTPVQQKTTEHVQIFLAFAAGTGSVSGFAAPRSRAQLPIVPIHSSFLVTGSEPCALV